MRNQEFDLQKLTFFTEGNTFTGGRTKNWDTGEVLRYLVKPDKENGRLLAYAWTADVCFEKAESPHEASFPLSDQGLEEIQGWLEKEYGQPPEET